MWYLWDGSSFWVGPWGDNVVIFFADLSGGPACECRDWWVTIWFKWSYCFNLNRRSTPPLWLSRWRSDCFNLNRRLTFPLWLSRGTRGWVWWDKLTVMGCRGRRIGKKQSRRRTDRRRRYVDGWRRTVGDEGRTVGGRCGRVTDGVQTPVVVTIWTARGCCGWSRWRGDCNGTSQHWSTFWHNI